ncbi:hypothetical protein Amsp01_055540 [Amycolatopsis sp. NBRC 101858]|nr:hypothetical protein Amsp01_055540 [Amycolatopsis sp. NBRC 101858]
MCREPVTFGGGSTIENGGFSDAASAVKYPAATQRSYIGASSAAGSQAPGRSVVCCGAFSVTMDKSTNPSRRVTQGEGTLRWHSLSSHRIRTIGAWRRTPT